MKFDIITIFPEAFDSYLSTSILARAQAKNFIDINTHSLRNFTTDAHQSVDDRPYGGGAGMVMMAEPILKAVKAVKKNRKGKIKIVLFSAKGAQFDQSKARSWAKNYKNIIFINGRYEGIDERVRTILKADEISIGPYVLTDGDVAAMGVISAISRLVPGGIKLEYSP